MFSSLVVEFGPVHVVFTVWHSSYLRERWFACVSSRMDHSRLFIFLLTRGANRVNFRIEV